jgi:hypothetical protein
MDEREPATGASETDGLRGETSGDPAGAGADVHDAASGVNGASASTTDRPSGDDDPAAPTAPLPGDRPGRRQLAAPPSERYVTTEEPTPIPAGGSAGRGIVLGALVAAFVGAILVILGGAFSFTAGLVVVALFLGSLTATAVKAGAGSSLSPSGRASIAVVIALLALALAQVGLWAWAWADGGRLGLFEFLGQVFGLLVPIEFTLAAAAAWWSSR